MGQPRFGLRQMPDERDKQYPMRLMLDPLREQFFPRGLPPGSRHYNVGPVLDQGETGTCVAHGWTARSNDAPIMQALPMSPFDLYRSIVKIDEWEDNDWESNGSDDQLQSGTSVRAGAQTLRTLGTISNFLWAESVEDIRAWHLANFGGVVIGVPWSDKMMETDSEGFINYTGTIVGGHCVASKGWNDSVKYRGRKERALRIKQSWGPDWGENGYAWIREHDLLKLFADHGEFCAPVETRVTPLQVG